MDHYPDTSSITWSRKFAQNENAIAIRYGTLYNFRFDHQPPNPTPTVGYFKTGSATAVVVQAAGNVPLPSPPAHSEPLPHRPRHRQQRQPQRVVALPNRHNPDHCTMCRALMTLAITDYTVTTIALPFSFTLYDQTFTSRFVVHGRHWLVKVVSVVINWALPLDDRLTEVKVWSYKVNGKGSATVVTVSSP